MANKKIMSMAGALAIVATFISIFIFMDPFQKSFPSVSLFGSCNADNISGANKVESKWITQTGTDLVVQGWAADIDKKTVASEVSVFLIDSFNNVIGNWTSKYDTDRPDVAQAFSNPAMIRSGMNIRIGAIAIPGTYKVQFGSVNENQYQICTVPVQLEVRAIRE